MRASSKGHICWVFAALVMLLADGPAQATSPGQNGRIAYEQFNTGTGRFNIDTVEPDGSNPQATIVGANDSHRPAWSPSGQRIAFDRFTGGHQQVLSVLSDGSGLVQHTTEDVYGSSSPTWSPDAQRLAFFRNGDIFIRELGTGQETRVVDFDDFEAIVLNLDWSPDGSKIAFQQEQWFQSCDEDGECFTGFDRPDIWLLNLLDGTLTALTTNDSSVNPSWSPDGDRIVFGSSSSPRTIRLMNEDGSNNTLLASPPAVTDYSQPDWSPDGTRIAFVSSTFGSPAQIYTMNTSGGDIQQVTTDAAGKQFPDWQPMPVNTASAYAGPEAATPTYLPLVPAYGDCTTPNRQHGGGLTFGSCSPPNHLSPTLTVGVGDGSPAFSRSVGFVRLKALPGAAGAPDDADMAIRLSLTNVMRKSDLSDYTGELGLDLSLQLTDHEGAVSQTTMGFDLSATAPCTPTASTIDGATCDLNTTVEALIPNAVAEGARETFALGPIKVRDGGPDEDADTPAGDGVVATQGVFVP